MANSVFPACSWTRGDRHGHAGTGRDAHAEGLEEATRETDELISYDKTTIPW
jgi:hypothetical protein